MTVKGDGQRFLVLQVRREEQRARHRPPERRRRDRIAAMPADGFVHEIRRHRRIDAHTIRDGLYQVIFHFNKSFLE